MKSRLEKVYSKLPNQKVNLKAHKVTLSLVSKIIDLGGAFDKAESEASYLAYEYGDEIMSAYEDFKRKYDLDNYIVNGATRDLDETTEFLSDDLKELETKANELGIDPNEIYDNFDDLKQRVGNATSLLKDAKDKYREVTEYTGMPNLWN